jgi:hypothetical protein
MEECAAFSFMVHNEGQRRKQVALNIATHPSAARDTAIFKKENEDITRWSIYTFWQRGSKVLESKLSRTVDRKI